MELCQELYFDFRNVTNVRFGKILELTCMRHRARVSTFLKALVVANDENIRLKSAAGKIWFKALTTFFSYGYGLVSNGTVPVIPKVMIIYSLEKQKGPWFRKNIGLFPRLGSLGVSRMNEKFASCK